MLKRTFVLLVALLYFITVSNLVLALPSINGVDSSTKREPRVIEKVAPQDQLLEVKEVKAPADKRAKILKAYLAQYNSPLRDQAQNFVDAADTYDLDWKLVAAISGVESTFGKFVPGTYEVNSYNAWGWGVYGDQTLYFKSWRDGIFTVSKGLRSNYLNKGLNDPYAINRVYAASPTWGSKVTYFLEDMAKFEKQYQLDDQKPASSNLTTQIAGTSALLASKQP